MPTNKAKEDALKAAKKVLAIGDQVQLQKEMGLLTLSIQNSVRTINKSLPLYKKKQLLNSPEQKKLFVSNYLESEKVLKATHLLDRIKEDRDLNGITDKSFVAQKELLKDALEALKKALATLLPENAVPPQAAPVKTSNLSATEQKSKEHNEGREKLKNEKLGLINNLLTELEASLTSGKLYDELVGEINMFVLETRLDIDTQSTDSNFSFSKVIHDGSLLLTRVKQTIAAHNQQLAAESADNSSQSESPSPQASSSSLSSSTASIRDEDEDTSKGTGNPDQEDKDEDSNPNHEFGESLSTPRSRTSSVSSTTTEKDNSALAGSPQEKIIPSAVSPVPASAAPAPINSNDPTELATLQKTLARTEERIKEVNKFIQTSPNFDVKKELDEELAALSELQVNARKEMPGLLDATMRKQALPAEVVELKKLRIDSQNKADSATAKRIDCQQSEVDLVLENLDIDKENREFEPIIAEISAEADRIASTEIQEAKDEMISAVKDYIQSLSEVKTTAEHLKSALSTNEVDKQILASAQFNEAQKKRDIHLSAFNNKIEPFKKLINDANSSNLKSKLLDLKKSLESVSLPLDENSINKLSAKLDKFLTQDPTDGDSPADSLLHQKNHPLRIDLEELQDNLLKKRNPAQSIKQAIASINANLKKLPDFSLEPNRREFTDIHNEVVKNGRIDRLLEYFIELSKNALTDATDRKYILDNHDRLLKLKGQLERYIATVDDKLTRTQINSQLSKILTTRRQLALDYLNAGISVIESNIAKIQGNQQLFDHYGVKSHIEVKYDDALAKAMDFLKPPDSGSLIPASLESGKEAKNTSTANFTYRWTKHEVQISPATTVYAKMVTLQKRDTSSDFFKTEIHLGTQYAVDREPKPLLRVGTSLPGIMHINMAMHIIKEHRAANADSTEVIRFRTNNLPHDLIEAVMLYAEYKGIKIHQLNGPEIKISKNQLKVFEERLKKGVYEIDYNPSEYSGKKVANIEAILPKLKK